MDIGSPPSTEAEAFFRNLTLKVLVTRRTCIGDDWSLDLCSPYWRLYVNKDRGGFIDMGDGRIPLRPGTLYLIPAWLRFSTGVTTPTMQSYIHFEFQNFPSGIHRAHFQRPLSLPLTGQLLQTCSRWEDALIQDNPLWIALAHAYAIAYSAMATALEEYPEGRGCFAWAAGSGRFKPALDFIADHLAKPIRNEELARRCGMSTSHFIRMFRGALGVTPTQYVMDRRIASSAEMLTCTERSIEDIAESLGFSDRFHFSKAFAQRLNATPAAYRRSLRSASVSGAA
ncbi:helix-turn-helix domain-containing protein [Terrimicrobium sacchariphilum]|uniref:Helix-turn-helix domain-containing protein n=1 Tax=Terrimicrobium sacchariphilum TaxID=690879 RepID=A0A146G228_TERSA|nr:AraC family transcriptional regulator [Terrimicrobium sacchariphilum]GAT31885.1 helix-turn-helix domain-containing protein [Terrimicrobium sacchariphilum]